MKLRQAVSIQGSKPGVPPTAEEGIKLGGEARSPNLVEEMQ